MRPSTAGGFPRLLIILISDAKAGGVCGVQTNQGRIPASRLDRPSIPKGGEGILSVRPRGC